MIVFTSAKSRLMMPGTVMMSEMPCTAWRRMSSAMRNASKKLVPRSTVSIKRSFGMTMTVSTAPINSCSACSACIMRRLPSNAKGLVTTATLKAPSSLASEATTGAAPLPVPPPRPAVMKIMSAPSSPSMIFSVSSSAALRPTSGLAPAPSPLVSFAPSCSLTGACDSLRACKSVFAVMNSTPSSLARIMRFTALQPPPPTPITLIFAGCSSSLKLIRIPASFPVMFSSISSTFAAPVAGLRGAGEHGLQFGYQIHRARGRGAARLGAIQNEPDDRRVFGLSDLLRQIAQAFWLGDAHGQVKGLFHQFIQAIQTSAAAGKDKSGGNLAVQAGALQVVADQRKQFHGARLDDVRERVRENGARRAVTDAGNLNGAVFSHERRSGAAVAALDALGLRDGRAQAHGKIICKVVAADRNGCGVANDAAAVNQDFGRAATDVQKAAAKVALILREAGFGGSKRLESGVADENSRFVCGSNKILGSGDGGGHDINIGDQALADHADGVANIALRVHEEFVREDVKHLAVFRKRNVACCIDGAAHIFALDIARARAECDSAAAVHAPHMASSHTDERFFYRDVGHAFGFFDGAANGADRGVKIHDQALAQAFGFGRAERQEFYEIAVDFRDEDRSLGAANVEPNQVFVFLHRAAAPYRRYCFLPIAVPALVSGFTTTCRVYCKSMDCTRPACACHCEKLSTSILNLREKSPE